MSSQFHKSLFRVFYWSLSWLVKIVNATMSVFSRNDNGFFLLLTLYAYGMEVILVASFSLIKSQGTFLISWFVAASHKTLS